MIYQVHCRYWTILQTKKKNKKKQTTTTTKKKTKKKTNRKIGKEQIHGTVNSYWKNRIIESCSSYQSLTYLNADGFQPGHVNKYSPSQGITRLCTKLKLITDTYILQFKRSKFSGKTAVTSICLLCNEEQETQEHFLLKCKLSQSLRDTVTNVIDQLGYQHYNQSF